MEPTRDENFIVAPSPERNSVDISSGLMSLMLEDKVQGQALEITLVVAEEDSTAIEEEEVEVEQVQEVAEPTQGHKIVVTTAAHLGVDLTTILVRLSIVTVARSQ